MRMITSLSFPKMSVPFHKSSFFSKSCVTQIIYFKADNIPRNNTYITKIIYPQKFPEERSHRTLALMFSILLVWLLRHKYLLPANLPSTVFPVVFRTLFTRWIHMCLCLQNTDLSASGSGHQEDLIYLSFPFVVPLLRFCSSV